MESPGGVVVGILDVPYCPNPDCPQEKLKKGEKCPLCGALAEEFGVSAAGNLLAEKKRRQKMKKQPESMEVLISDEMTDEEIKTKIYEDMSNLKIHEKGTGIDSFLTILSGSPSERVMASLLKAIVDQNKIIIRQNELIIRGLRRLCVEAK